MNYNLNEKIEAEFDYLGLNNLNIILSTYIVFYDFI